MYVSSIFNGALALVIDNKLILIKKKLLIEGRGEIELRSLGHQADVLPIEPPLFVWCKYLYYKYFKISFSYHYWILNSEE